MEGPRYDLIELANLENQMAALRASNERLREAVALLNSMVLSGESHSDRSRQLVKDAVAQPW